MLDKLGPCLYDCARRGAIAQSDLRRSGIDGGWGVVFSFPRTMLT
jgi:hypothetical protein